MKIEERLESVISRIHSSCGRVGRDPAEIVIVAATKTQSADVVQRYCDIALGRGLQIVLGESYVNEWEKKRTQIRMQTLSAHYIGRMQSNKVREAVTLFDCIQSVHSEKIARVVEREGSRINRIVDVLLQINISSDSAKSGFTAAEGESFLRNAEEEFRHLRVRGLMTITKQYSEPEGARADYRALAALSRQLRGDGAPLGSELSMGMSSDFEVAIEEGATMIRVGSAIFGERDSR